MNRFNFFKGVVLLMALTLTTSCEKVKDAWNDVHIEDGLAGYYTFDDGTANDMSKNGADGVLINDPEFITETVNGKGQAVFFSSSEDQYMSIPYNAFSGLKTYSTTMWVKDFGVGSFLKLSEHDKFNSSFNFYYDEDGYLKLLTYYFDSRGETFTYDAKKLLDSRWHMIALVREEGLVKLYVDSKLASTLEVHNSSTDFPSMVIKNIMKFDNLRIYNRAISAKEVKAIYDKEK